MEERAQAMMTIVCRRQHNNRSSETVAFSWQENGCCLLPSLHPSGENADRYGAEPRERPLWFLFQTAGGLFRGGCNAVSMEERRKLK